MERMSERERKAVYAESYRATRAAARHGLEAWKSAMRREFERQNPETRPIFGGKDMHPAKGPGSVEYGYRVLSV